MGIEAVRGLIDEAEKLYNDSYTPIALTGEGFDIKAINREIARMSEMRGKLAQAFRDYPAQKKYAKWRDKYDAKIDALKRMQNTHAH